MSTMRPSRRTNRVICELRSERARPKGSGGTSPDRGRPASRKTEDPARERGLPNPGGEPWVFWTRPGKVEATGGFEVGRSGPVPEWSRSEERRVGKECESRWAP